MAGHGLLQTVQTGRKWKLRWCTPGWVPVCLNFNTSFHRQLSIFSINWIMADSPVSDGPAPLTVLNLRSLTRARTIAQQIENTASVQFLYTAFLCIWCWQGLSIKLSIQFGQFNLTIIFSLIINSIQSEPSNCPNWIVENTVHAHPFREGRWSYCSCSSCLRLAGIGTKHSFGICTLFSFATRERDSFTSEHSILKSQLWRFMYSSRIPPEVAFKKITSWSALNSIHAPHKESTLEMKRCSHD